jgi:hypothetical protein
VVLASADLGDPHAIALLFDAVEAALELVHVVVNKAAHFENPDPVLA